MEQPKYYKASDYYNLCSDRTTMRETIDDATWKWMNRTDVKARLETILGDFGICLEGNAEDVIRDECKNQTAEKIVRGVRETSLVSWGTASPDTVQADARAKITCELLKRIGM